MTNHIIHKQHVLLNIPAKESAFDYQNTVSRLFKNGLAKQLDEVFNGLAGAGEIIRLDTLRLDLGTINAQNFEQEFKERVIEEISRQVSLKKNTTKTHTEPRPVTRALSLKESFIYFLQFGSLPWFAHVDNVADWEAEMLALFSRQDWQYTARWLQDNWSKNTQVAKRLILQFSDDFIRQLILKAANDFVESLENVFNDLNYLLVTFAGIKPLEARNSIWQAVFEYFVLRKEKPALSYMVISEFALKLSAEQLRNISTSIKSIDAKIHTKGIKAILSKLAAFANRKMQAGEKTETNNESLPLREQILHFLTDHNEGDEFQIESLRVRRDVTKENELIGLQVPAKPFHTEEAFYVSNAGLVILHPFLEPYFSGLELMHKKNFLNEELHARAVLLLHYLVTGNEAVAEFELILEKIVCGFPLEETLPAQIELTDKEKDESTKLLQSVTDYWPPLKNTSVEGLRNSFLQREGKLNLTDSGWKLVIEQKTIDILLGKLPWGFSTIRFPWMKEVISVEWC